MAAGQKQQSRRKRAKMGRPKGSGGPPELVRRHRITITLNNGELKKLQHLAQNERLPLGTLAHRYVSQALKRRK